MSSPPSPNNNSLALSAPVPNLPEPVQNPNPRRLPPPCWSHDETAALIDSYRDKWYSLNRGNLRANHWQEVADSVFQISPIPTGPKTPVQCRHKMEKLRKRYRNDLNRAKNRPGPVSSTWVHFNRMHAMEKGSNIDDDGAEEEEDEDDEELYQSIRHGMPNHGYRINSGKNPSFGDSTRVVGNGFREKYSNFDPNPSFGGVTRVVGNGYREKSANFDREPSFVGVSRVAGNGYREKVANFGPNPCRGVGSAEKLGKRKEREGEREAMGEMVAAVRALGDGFVRMEKMKMEMAREVEVMRMEMELKRTEMILESQQRIVEAFATAYSESHKEAKERGSSES